MNSKFPKSVEEQFRTSQVYKTLSGAGDVPHTVAKNLEKVAAVVDTTVQTVNQSVAQGFGGQVNQASRQPRPPQGGRPYPPPRAPHPTQGPVPHGAPVPPPNQFKRAGKQIPVPGPGQQVKEIQKANMMKYIVTAIGAVFYAANGNLASISDLIGFLIVVAIVYAISGKIFRDKKEYVLVDIVEKKPEPAPAPKAAQKPVSKTGDPQADALIEEGSGMIRQIASLGASVQDESIRECVNRMTVAFADILDYISENPKKASQVRRFMDYYLPTSLKLLEKYQMLDRQAVKGENIKSSMEDIDRFMYTVATAFEKQLDSLFGDDAMDISADISVFETMLKQEGLQDADLKMKYKE